MSLVSLKYLLFVLTIVIIYYISPKKFKWLILLIASYTFYVLSSKKLVIFLILSTLSVYLSSLLLGRENKKLNVDISSEEKKILKKEVKKNKKIILITTLFINFGILVFLKYINFLSIGINGYLNYVGFNYQIPKFKFLLPLGISYYTLQAISYVIDVYRNKYEPTKNIGKVALFVSFFPQITEGPIGRFDKLANQLYDSHKLEFSNILTGFCLIVIGFFKKLVIADRAGIFVNEVFKGNFGGFTVFLAGILYTLQIYAEFQGCMDIVSGTAKLFAIDLSKNFNRPFFSKSIQEFWQRWHITLGSWIKDYIFYPVSLSKMSMSVNMACRKYLKGHLAKFIIVAFPLLFVWLFNGLWHGASFKYVAYGMYYYIIMMAGLLFMPIGNKIINAFKINVDSKKYHLFQILRTNLFVVIGMFLFRSKTLKIFVKKFITIFTGSYSGILNHGLFKIDFIILLVYVVVILILGILNEKGKNTFELFKKIPKIFQVMIFALIIMLIIILGIYGDGYNASDFIYGQF